MSLQYELKNNAKPLIRRVNKNRVFSVSVPKEFADKIKLQNHDHVKFFVDEKNQILLIKRLEVDE